METAKSSQGFSVLTVTLDNPEGYGRIFRKEDGTVEKIVETVDLEEGDQKIAECNRDFCNSGWLLNGGCQI